MIKNKVIYGVPVGNVVECGECFKEKQADTLKERAKNEKELRKRARKRILDNAKKLDW